MQQAIKDELSQYISVDIPDAETIIMHNMDICEPVQPDEAAYRSDENPFAIENARYTTVALEDAGAEDEQVITRTFVNASIGGKKLRIRTRTAPYMLLLSTLQGESEPGITICNQFGTFCLQRDFTAGDLAEMVRAFERSPGAISGTKLSEPFALNFDSVAISISFQYLSDLEQFIDIPSAYFDAVRQREPVDSEQFPENIIFTSSVEAVEQLRAPAMKPMNPASITRSCQVRVLERSFGEAWRSVRRLVVSSSMAEKGPCSFEYFMPLSGSYVKRSENSHAVQLKWSATGQERLNKTDGNYNRIFTYIYDENSPNIGLEIQFRSEQRAAEFEHAILSLAHSPSFSWSQDQNSGNVYDVTDVATDQKEYNAILLLITNRVSFKFSCLHYLFRDTDYTYDSQSRKIKFPRIFYVDYISSHVEQLYRAADINQVFFSHCEKKIGNTTTTFADEEVFHQFMSTLASTSGYELCFARRAESITTKKKQPFIGSNKSSKGEAEVYLWRRGDSFQLACRWANTVSDRWLTRSVPPGHESSSSTSRASSHDCANHRIEFPVTGYTRGSVLNLAIITSTNPKDAKMAKRTGPVGITFGNAKDRDDFIVALDGKDCTKWKYDSSAS